MKDFKEWPADDEWPEIPSGTYTIDPSKIEPSSPLDNLEVVATHTMGFCPSCGQWEKLNGCQNDVYLCDVCMRGEA